VRRQLLVTLLWLASAAASAAPATLPDLLDLPALQDARTLNGLMLDIAAAGSRLVAVGEYGAILYSDDAGISWRQAEVPVQVTLTALDFPTPTMGWAVGHDAVILHTADAGETWQRQLDGRQTGDKLLAAAEIWVAEVEAQAATGNSVGDQLMVQQDAAMLALDEALREQEMGPNRPFLDVWFADDRNGFAIGAFNYFFVTKDGGMTWADGSARLPNPEFLHLYSMTPQADGSLVMVGEFGLVLRSADGGEVWETLSIGYQGTLFQAASAGGRTWVAGLRGNIFYSDDLGENWNHLETSVHSSWLGVRALPDRRALFAGLAGSLLRVDPAAPEPVSYTQVARGHLAAVYLTRDGGTLVAGEGGLRLLEQSGQVVELQYLAEVN
jgi:photosystem II stability/assembly factor-like uncharacterized protein